MNGVSAVIACDLTAGDEQLVGTAPLVLTSLVAIERTGLDPAAVTLSGAAGEGPYYRLRIEPGSSLTFSDAVALPWGLLVACQSGEVLLSLGYR